MLPFYELQARIFDNRVRGAVPAAAGRAVSPMHGVVVELPLAQGAACSLAESNQRRATCAVACRS